MQFNEIRKGLENVVFDKIRSEDNNFFEAVLVRDELEKLTGILEGFFGLPAYPCENKLSLQIEEAVSAFGGIKPGQTLYFWNDGGQTIFAMVWPWEDGWHATLKIIQK